MNMMNDKLALAAYGLTSAVTSFQYIFPSILYQTLNDMWPSGFKNVVAWSTALFFAVSMLALWLHSRHLTAPLPLVIAICLILIALGDALMVFVRLSKWLFLVSRVIPSLELVDNLHFLKRLSLFALDLVFFSRKLYYLS
jgi:hypothetical protein